MSWEGVGTIASIVISLVALGISIRANRAAGRSADAAERQATAAEAALPPPPPRVGWHAELVRHGAGTRIYTVRNVGTDAATGVRFRDDGGSVRVYDQDRTIRPGSAIRVVVLNVGDAGNPRELEVFWDGQDDPAIVPL